MRFLPIIDLWAAGTQAAIAAGRLQLQVGQWVYAGNKQHPSRFIGVSDRGIFDVVHWQGDGKRTLEAFKQRAQSARLAKLYQEDRDAWKAVRDALRAQEVTA